MAFNPWTASATVRPKHPTVSRFALMGIIPFLDVRPTVGLIPTIPFIEAGPIIEVSVSVPNERGTIFAETETADPELDPTNILISIGCVHRGESYRDCARDYKGF